MTILEVLGWMKANAAVLKFAWTPLRWAHGRFRQWWNRKQGLTLGCRSDVYGVPFRDDWHFVAIPISNDGLAVAGDLSVTMEFSRGRAVFNTIRVPVLWQDKESI